MILMMCVISIITESMSVKMNGRRTAMHLNAASTEKIDKMADVYTEGYRIGFVNTGKDLSKKINSQYLLYDWIRAGDQKSN